MAIIKVSNKDYEILAGSYAAVAYTQEAIQKVTTEAVESKTFVTQDQLDEIIFNVLMIVLPEGEFSSVDDLKKKIRKSEVSVIELKMGELFLDNPEIDKISKKAVDALEATREESSIEKKQEVSGTENQS